MRRTGIFFHYQMGGRLRDFPHLLGPILSQPNIFLYDAFYPLKPRSNYELEPVSRDLILEVHTESLVQQVEQTGYYQTAVLSAGGTVQAVQRIWEGDIDNAFVFTGSGDHHAGRDFFGGWCYFNGAAMAVAEMRRSHGVSRFAVVDTDPHHGDGTWDIFRDDPDILYVCFCGGESREENSKVNVPVVPHTSDESYLRQVQEEFLPRIRKFCPEVVFWNWGYDGTQGEYGDIGLTPDVHFRLARLFKKVTEEVCEGKLIVVLCGGHSREVANHAIPRIVTVLGEAD